MEKIDFRNLRTPFLLDGATGTQLQKRGMPAGVCSEQWILEHPEAIVDVQRRYVEAGSQVIYAPTFGANRITLGRHGLADRVKEYNHRLVELSRQAADGRALVGGDIAPTGLAMGIVDEELFNKLVENFTEQAQALEEAGVDLFAVETQMSLAEARASVIAIRSVSDKPIFVSFTLGSDGRTLTGGNICSALLAMEELGIDAFGINCVGDLTLLRYTLQDLSSLTRLPLIAKPNAGFPEERDGQLVYTMKPEILAGMTEAFMGSGAMLLGGCCGTDERHIAALKFASGRADRRMRELDFNEWYASEYEAVRYIVPTDEFEEMEDEEAIPQEWQLEGTEVCELVVDEDFEENAEEAAFHGAQLLKLYLGTEEEVRTVLDSQMSVKTPLWVVIHDEKLRAKFLREYNGRPKTDF